MARMDNAYRLIMGMLKRRMMSLAVIEAETGFQAADVEAALAREPSAKLAADGRKKILDAISQRIPVRVEDVFLNADKLANAYPQAFAGIAINAAGNVGTVADIPTKATADFLALVRGCSVNNETAIQRIDDKAAAIAAAHSVAVETRLKYGNDIDKLIAGPSVKSMTWGQKCLFLWVTCYADAQRIELKDAFTDIFNYLGADDSALLRQVEFSEQTLGRVGRLDFNNFIIATLG